MTKCDFCERSYLKNGKLVCPFLGCILTSSDIQKIYETIKHIKE